MVDFKKIRKELIGLYQDFLLEPDNIEIRKKAIKYERDFGGLNSYNEILRINPVPKDIEEGLGCLSFLYQYGDWEDDHEAFSKEKIILKAEKILRSLKENH